MIQTGRMAEAKELARKVMLRQTSLGSYDPRPPTDQEYIDYFARWIIEFADKT